MKVKKIPIRTCIVTKESYPKQELIRVVKYNNEVVVDKTNRMNGRGAYLKKDKEVFELARKKKLLERSLGVEIKESIYEELNNLL